jgi:hypothetical protein
MSPLLDLQTDFQSYLLHGGERMQGRVTGTVTASASMRLAIYYEAYRLRLIEALESNYPVLHAWIGDKDFEELGLAYLQTHPSRYFSIRYFGHRLPEYLAREQAYRDKPYLHEMAALEWAISEAFDAHDSVAVTIDDMAAIPPETWPAMHLQLHASVRRLDLQWNIAAIWKAIKAKIAAEESVISSHVITHDSPAIASEQTNQDAKEDSSWDIPAPAAGAYPQSWLIWRQHLKTYFRSASVDEGWAIDAALGGGDFANICEGLCEWIDAQNVASHSAGLLKRWVTDGMISGIALSPTRL